MPFPADWTSRKRIDLPIPAADQVDFPAKVPIVADADIGAECLATGYDLRFVAADGVTLLSYERESFAVVAGEASGIFWVKTDVATTGTYIWCYYGNPDATDGENAEAVWDANFKAVYHMKDATTSTIADSTANNNHGTKDAANTPIEADGKIGKGQDFNSANNENIDVADNATLDITAALAISLWVKPETNPAWAAAVTKGISTTWDGHNYVLGLQAGRAAGRWQGKGSILADVGDALTLGAWSHIVFVVEPGTTNALKLYKNGALIKQANRTGDPTPTDKDLRLGSDSGAIGGDHIDGIMDEIRISGAARTAAWIAYEYANMNPADGGLTWGAEESAANVTLPVTGNAGSAVVGTIVLGLMLALSGNSTGMTYPLTEVSGTGAVGTVAPAKTVAVSGVSANPSYALTGVAAGPAYPLSGVSAIGEAGNIVYAEEILGEALSGVEATGALGTVTPLGGGVEGAAMTGSVGAVTPAEAQAASGNTATGAVGTVPPARSKAISGLSAPAAPGTVGVFITHEGDIYIALTGITRTGSPGTVGPRHAIAFFGVTGTGEASGFRWCVPVPLEPPWPAGDEDVTFESPCPAGDGDVVFEPPWPPVCQGD